MLDHTQTFEHVSVNGKIYKRRFSPRKRLLPGALPRVCGEASADRLSLPPRPQRNLGGQKVGQHRPGVARGRPLQMARHALGRRRRALLHGRRPRPREIPEVRGGHAADARQPHVPLVPPGAGAVFRNRRPAALRRHRRRGLGQGQRRPRRGADREEMHVRQPRGGCLHYGRPDERPRIPQENRRERLWNQGSAHVPPRQGLRHRRPRKLHRVSHKARRGLGHGDTLLRGFAQRAQTPPRLLPQPRLPRIRLRR